MNEKHTFCLIFIKVDLVDKLSKYAILPEFQLDLIKKYNYFSTPDSSLVHLTGTYIFNDAYKRYVSTGLGIVFISTKDIRPGNDDGKIVVVGQASSGC